MKKNIRLENILSLLQKMRQVSVQEFTERLKVSQVTIRKDLNYLEEQGLIVRSHGAARLTQDINKMPNVSTRKESNAQAKGCIAQRALELIQPGDSICLDAGSTNLLLAQKLQHIPLRVTTNSLDILQCLQANPDISLTALGGSLRREAGSFIGPIAETAVASLHFDVAFIGATAFTAQGVFLSQNMVEGQLKSAMLESAKRRVILADSSKFNASAFAAFAHYQQVDILICEGPFHGIDNLRSLGIEVIFDSSLKIGKS
jgi:DeoR/GlpR family transcriptional regulator of sugar metabolism